MLCKFTHHSAMILARGPPQLVDSLWARHWVSPEQFQCVLFVFCWHLYVMNSRCGSLLFQDGWIIALDGRCVLGAVVRPHLLLSISQQTSISHQSGCSPQNSNSSRFKVFSFSSTSWSEVRYIQKSEVFKCQKYSEGQMSDAMWDVKSDYLR